MESNSKERILNAAIKIIAQKGKHGTRIEDVAQKADINKAMVYYYYSTKDNLYFEVLKTIFSNKFKDALNNLNEDISNGKSHEDIISNSIRHSFENFNSNPDYTRIMIDALSNGLDEIPRALELISGTSNLTPAVGITKIIQDGIDKKIFRSIDPQQTLISITGMIFIYFLSRSIIKFFNVTIDDEEEFIKNRLDSIVDLIMNGIRVR